MLFGAHASSLSPVLLTLPLVNSPTVSDLAVEGRGAATGAGAGAGGGHRGGAVAAAVHLTVVARRVHLAAGGRCRGGAGGGGGAHGAQRRGRGVPHGDPAGLVMATPWLSAAGQVAPSGWECPSSQ